MNKKQTRFEEISRPIIRAFHISTGLWRWWGGPSAIWMLLKKHIGNYNHNKAAQHSTSSFGAGISGTLVCWHTGLHVPDDHSYPIPHLPPFSLCLRHTDLLAAPQAHQMLQLRTSVLAGPSVWNILPLDTWMAHSFPYFIQIPPSQRGQPQTTLSQIGLSTSISWLTLFFFTALWLFEIILCICVLPASLMSMDFNCVVHYCISSSQVVPA